MPFCGLEEASFDPPVLSFALCALQYGKCRWIKPRPILQGLQLATQSTDELDLKRLHDATFIHPFSQQAFSEHVLYAAF